MRCTIELRLSGGIVDLHEIWLLGLNLILTVCMHQCHSMAEQKSVYMVMQVFHCFATANNFLLCSFNALLELVACTASLSPPGFSPVHLSIQGALCAVYCSHAQPDTAS